MLTIRQAQWDALGAAGVEASKGRLAELVERHWPDERARLGPAGVRAQIDRVFEACARRGVVVESDIARYLNVSLAIGADFEDDPRYRWARAVLDDTSLRPTARVARLSVLVAEELALRAEEQE